MRGLARPRPARARPPALATSPPRVRPVASDAAGWYVGTTLAARVAHGGPQRVPSRPWAAVRTGQTNSVADGGRSRVAFRPAPAREEPSLVRSSASPKRAREPTPGGVAGAHAPGGYGGCARARAKPSFRSSARRLSASPKRFSDAALQPNSIVRVTVRLPRPLEARSRTAPCVRARPAIDERVRGPRRSRGSPPRAATTDLARPWRPRESRACRAARG